MERIVRGHGAKEALTDERGPTETVLGPDVSTAPEGSKGGKHCTGQVDGGLEMHDGGTGPLQRERLEEDVDRRGLSVEEPVR